MSRGVRPHHDALLADAMAEMTRRRQRHLPVLEHGRLVGIVSVGDLVKNRLDDSNWRRTCCAALTWRNGFADR